MIQAEDFISACTSRGYAFFTGVPCSLLGSLINHVIDDTRLDYVAASSEGEAVAIAAGVYLGGGKTVVMCQNSGLGNAVNPLSSLNFPFRIPTLLLITHRGEPGLKDEPQHELMGQITGTLLDVLRIPSTTLPDNPGLMGDALEEAEGEMKASSLPYAFIMKRGTVCDNDLSPVIGGPMAPTQTDPGGTFVCPPEKRMSRFEAIRIIRETLPDETAIVATTGKIGRELFTLADTGNHLYLVGSMGCASAVGFGIQHAQPDRRVVVLDGDGATLMKMGTLATIGHYRPSRLIHVILDNESYESTGGQFTVSPTVDFCKVGAACGYNQCIRADTKENLTRAINRVEALPGPSLIHTKVARGSASGLGRPTLKPYEVRKRFMRFLQSGSRTK